MNLKEFRKLFVATSGRYDLVNDDDSDNGADFYIQAGQRYLETICHWDKQEAVHTEELRNLSVFMLPNLRAITSVMARLASSTTWVELVRVPLSQARTYAANNLETGLDVPLFYTLIRSRGEAGITSATTPDFFVGYGDYQEVLDGQNFDSVGLYLTPLNRSAESLIVEVHGTFRSVKLESETDVNFWTSEWPALLLYAASRELEVFQRNMNGVREWEVSIMSVLSASEMDMIQDESNAVSVMRG